MKEKLQEIAEKWEVIPNNEFPSDLLKIAIREDIPFLISAVKLSEQKKAFYKSQMRIERRSKEKLEKKIKQLQDENETFKTKYENSGAVFNRMAMNARINQQQKRIEELEKENKNIDIIEKHIHTWQEKSKEQQKRNEELEKENEDLRQKYYDAKER